MSHLYRTINKYHDVFESFSRIPKSKNPRIWIILISLFGFIEYGYISVVFNQDWYIHGYRVKDISLFICVSFEIIGLLAFLALHIQKEDLALKQCKIKYPLEKVSLDDYKRLWLKKHLDYAPHEYSELIKLIERNLTNRKKLKSVFDISKDDFAKSIFTQDSKPRIYALSLAIVSMLFVLSAKSGGSLYDVYKYFYSSSFWDWIFYLFVIAACLLISASFIKKLIYVVLIGLDIVFAKKGGENHISPMRVRAFMRTLIKFEEIKKPRLKVKNGEIIYNNHS